MSGLDSGSCGCGYGSAGGAPQFLSERDRVWAREGDQNAMAALAQNEKMSGTVPPTQTESVPPTQSQFFYSDGKGFTLLEPFESVRDGLERILIQEQSGQVSHAQNGFRDNFEVIVRGIHILHQS